MCCDVCCPRGGKQRQKSTKFCMRDVTTSSAAIFAELEVLPANRHFLSYLWVSSLSCLDGIIWGTLHVLVLFSYSFRRFLSGTLFLLFNYVSTMACLLQSPLRVEYRIFRHHEFPFKIGSKAGHHCYRHLSSPLDHKLLKTRTLLPCSSLAISAMLSTK